MKKLCAISFVTTLLIAGAAQAQTYPSKVVRIILGFPAGTTVDLLVRPVAQKLSESMGQQFIVENRSGATGLIANEAVARAAPDGYTLLGAPGSSLTSSLQLFAKPPVNVLRDYTPITQLGAFGYIFMVHPGVPAKNVKELIAIARAKPGFLTYGSSGVGSGFHLAGELFTTMARVKMLHVPYKGGAEALNDMIAGRIDVMFYSLAVAMPQIRAGKLKPLAVTGTMRDALLPELPTMDEAGLKGYEMSGWHGLLAPAGTPAAVVDKLNADIRRILQTPEIKKLWVGYGMATPSTTPAQFGAVIKSDYEKYAKLIKSAGIELR